MLGSAVRAICATVKWLEAAHRPKPGNRADRLPVVLVGFSFGGPAVWACVPRLQKVTRLAGVAAFAGSGRAGEEHETAKLDTERGVRVLAKSKVPCLFVHGSHDSNVDPEVAEYYYQAAAAAPHRRLARVLGADHLMADHRDLAYTELRQWVLAALSRGPAATDAAPSQRPEATGEALPGVTTGAQVVQLGIRPIEPPPTLRPRGPKARGKWANHTLAGKLGFVAV